LDLVEMKPRPIRLDDERHLFPLLERMQTRGVRSVAIHKAVPYALVPSAPFRYDDIDSAAASFPDLIFEIVHGGIAFLEEMTMQLEAFPNVVVNLEGTATFLASAPKLFERILGPLLRSAGPDRLVWATGNFVHPQPLLERFWEFEFSEELLDGLGIPPLTPEIKRKILGENMASITGVDFRGIRQALEDEFDRDQSGAVA
jgi:uncharacterized protein